MSERWKVSEVHPEFTEPVVVTEDGDLIAILLRRFGEDQGDERQRAAAHLVAAAPEMADALERLVAIMESHRMDWGHDGDEESGQHEDNCRACRDGAIVERAKAVLERARR